MFRSTLTTAARYLFLTSALLILGCDRPSGVFTEEKITEFFEESREMEIAEEIPRFTAQISDQLRAGEEFLVVEDSGTPSSWANTPAQKKISATDMAELRATKKLVGIIYGVAISARANNNLDTTEGAILSRIEGKIRGAQVYESEYDPSGGGSATVSMRMAITGQGGLYDMLAPLLTTAKLENEYSRQQTPENFPKADGLIVDVSEFYDFEPALVQHIESEQGDVLYGPGKVAQAFITKRGMASYASDLGKAKAILSGFGSRNPLLVKARALRGNHPQVSSTDASHIFAANQEESFLEKARVVFLLEE